MQQLINMSDSDTFSREAEGFPTSSPAAPIVELDAANRRIQALERELQLIRNELHSTIEQLRTSRQEVDLLNSGQSSDVQAQREAKQAAARDSRARRRFIAAVSHQLRQPLQTLSLLNSVLAQSSGGNGEIGQIVKRQADAVAAMGEQLNLLTDFARLEQGDIVPEIAVFSAAELLLKIGREFEPAAASRGIGLRIIACSVRLRSDPSLLYRIVHYLVSNAVLGTGTGRVVVGGRRRGDLLRFDVWDTGQGIPEERIATVFEGFVPSGNPAHKADKGHGLGLLVAKYFADILRLKLEVHSVPGQGSVFSVYVPLAS